MHPQNDAHLFQVTIQDIIDTISCRTKKQKDFSNKSISGSSAGDSWYQGVDGPQKKQKTKTWTQDEDQLFWELIDKYGTDFTLIKQFFPKKSKNQIKVCLVSIQRKYKNQIKTHVVKPKSKTNNPTEIKQMNQQCSGQKLVWRINQQQQRIDQSN